jgi:hypothetical protein
VNDARLAGGKAHGLAACDAGEYRPIPWFETFSLCFYSQAITGFSVKNYIDIRLKYARLRVDRARPLLLFAGVLIVRFCEHQTIEKLGLLRRFCLKQVWLVVLRACAHSRCEQMTYYKTKRRAEQEEKAWVNLQNEHTLVKKPHQARFF